MSFPHHERYKDSGHDWLGNIPAHWKVAKFRHHFVESREKIDGEVEGVMLSVSGYRGIEIKRYEDENQRRSEEHLVGYRIVRTGQLVVNTMWLNYAGLGVSDFDGHVSPAYRAYWVDDYLEKRFVHHLMRSQQYVLGYTKFLTGVRPNSLQMSRDDLMAFPVLVPPVDEQRSIAKFLDQETAKIDALIEEQRRLIDLLKEKRQAVICHAVTKGLDPGAPMKDSGTFWIGEIPQHWDVSSLRYFARFSSGSTPDRTKERYWGGDIPWVKTGEIDYAVINDTEEMITAEGMAESSVTLVPAGSMLLALYGQGVTRGRVAMLGVAATFNQACVAIESDERIDRAYLFAFFVFAYRFIREIGNETTQMNLNLDFVKAIRVPLPPLPEQRSIAEAVASHMSSSDSLIGEAMKAIELLQERRSALISAAVTGKIDVRSYNPKEAA